MFQLKSEKLLFLCALAISFSPRQLLAQDPEKPQIVTSTPTSIWRVNCHGIPNVPMTADPEQTDRKSVV